MFPAGAEDQPPKPLLESPSDLALRRAWAAFAVMFAMNLLDYTDRFVLNSVLGEVQGTFSISDAWAGVFNSAFLVSYSIFSPVMGWAGDRMKRTWLLALGVGVWSLATAGTGLARSYHEVVLARGLLGIGEATYGVIAPTILMDLFSRERRSQIMSAFYLAMPFGGALGMFLGAYVARHSPAWVAGTPLAPYGGWRMAFFVVGVPGLIAAFSSLLIREPIRGASEGVALEHLKAHEAVNPTWADFRDLVVNSSFNYAVLGMAAYTFAIGGLAYWMPKFLVYTRGIDPIRANTLLGATTAGAAIVGMSVGGWLADRLARVSPQALYVVPGLAMLGAVPFTLLGLFSTSEIGIFAGIFLAETLMFVNTGPCNAAIANVVLPNMRAAAYAISIFALHFLGDIWSPILMGHVADTFGQPDAMISAPGRALAAIGALPTQVPGHLPENLLAGMLVVVPAVVLSGLVFLIGARHLPRDMALMLARLRTDPPQPGKIAERDQREEGLSS